MKKDSIVTLSTIMALETLGTKLSVHSNRAFQADPYADLKRKIAEMRARKESHR